MKYKFNFNKPILQLDGTAYTDAKTGEEMSCNKTTAHTLSTCTSFSDYVKLMEWARTLYAGKELILDTSDANRLEKIIEDNKNLFPIVKEALMKIINDREKIDE